MSTQSHLFTSLGNLFRRAFSVHRASQHKSRTRPEHRPATPVFDPIKTKLALWKPNPDARPDPNYAPAPWDPPEPAQR
jgi:hypothetical protein